MFPPPSLSEARTLQITVEPEVQLISGGLQPVVFRTARGTLIAHGQIRNPPDHLPDAYGFNYWEHYVISHDGGQTWEAWEKNRPRTFQMVAEGVTAQLDDGTIRAFEFMPKGPTADGDFTGEMWDSHDDWQTVEGPKQFRIHLPEARADHGDTGEPFPGVPFHRTALRLPNGDLLATAYCWFHGDDTPVPYMPKMHKSRAVLLRSGDRGENWEYVSTIAVDHTIGLEGFTEPVMVRLSHKPHAGRLICLMRTGNRGDPIYQTHSDDDGRTWAKPWPTPLHGVDPDLIEMADGTLACSFGYRILTQPIPPEHGNYVAFSTDQGGAWNHVAQLPIEPHAGDTRSTCYTGLCEVAPGKLLVVYDIGWWGSPIRYVARRFVHVSRLQPAA